LPPLSLAEALETTKIHSIVVLLKPGPGARDARPFRAPHPRRAMPDAGRQHQSDAGRNSLAHHGVLFLDELPEFKRSVLETMQPARLKKGIVTISRAAGTMTFPSQFMLALRLTRRQMEKCPAKANHRRREIQIISADFPAHCSTALTACRSFPQVKFREISGDKTADPRKSARVSSPARHGQQKRFAQQPKIIATRAQADRTKEFCALRRRDEEMLRWR